MTTLKRYEYEPTAKRDEYLSAYLNGNDPAAGWSVHTAVMERMARTGERDYRKTLYSLADESRGSAQRYEKTERTESRQYVANTEITKVIGGILRRNGITRPSVREYQQARHEALITNPGYASDYVGAPVRDGFVEVLRLNQRQRQYGEPTAYMKLAHLITDEVRNADGTINIPAVIATLRTSPEHIQLCQDAAKEWFTARVNEMASTMFGGNAMTSANEQNARRIVERQYPDVAAMATAGARVNDRAIRDMFVQFFH